MSEFKAIETQEAFDAAIKSRLERHARTVTDEVTKKYEGYLSPEDAAKAAETYTGQIADLTAQLETLKTQVSDLTAKNQAHVQSAAKLRIAHEIGIPFELAGRLSGETEEEIRADAESLVKFTTSRQESPRFSGETPTGDPQNAALLQMLREMHT